MMKLLISVASLFVSLGCGAKYAAKTPEGSGLRLTATTSASSCGPFGLGGRVGSDIFGTRFTPHFFVGNGPGGSVVLGGIIDGRHSGFTRLKCDGTLDRTFGAGGVAYAGVYFMNRHGAGMDSSGRIYALDVSRAAVRRFSKNGKIDRTFSGGEAGGPPDFPPPPPGARYPGFERIIELESRVMLVMSNGLIRVWGEGYSYARSHHQPFFSDYDSAGRSVRTVIGDKVLDRNIHFEIDSATESSPGRPILLGNYGGRTAISTGMGERPVGLPGNRLWSNWVTSKVIQKDNGALVLYGSSTTSLLKNCYKLLLSYLPNLSVEGAFHKMGVYYPSLPEDPLESGYYALATQSREHLFLLFVNKDNVVKMEKRTMNGILVSSQRIEDEGLLHTVSDLQEWYSFYNSDLSWQPDDSLLLLAGTSFPQIFRLTLDGKPKP